MAAAESYAYRGPSRPQGPLDRVVYDWIGRRAILQKYPSNKVGQPPSKGDDNYCRQGNSCLRRTDKADTGLCSVPGGKPDVVGGSARQLLPPVTARAYGGASSGAMIDEFIRSTILWQQCPDIVQL